jgi:hypothetical protein
MNCCPGVLHGPWRAHGGAALVQPRPAVRIDSAQIKMSFFLYGKSRDRKGIPSTRHTGDSYTGQPYKHMGEKRSLL